MIAGASSFSSLCLAFLRGAFSFQKCRGRARVRLFLHRLPGRDGEDFQLSKDRRRKEIQHKHGQGSDGVRMAQDAHTEKAERRRIRIRDSKRRQPRRQKGDYREISQGHTRGVELLLQRDSGRIEDNRKGGLRGDRRPRSYRPDSHQSAEARTGCSGKLAYGMDYILQRLQAGEVASSRCGKQIRRKRVFPEGGLPLERVQKETRHQE